MYSQPIERHHPGCVLFLLDQSASMIDRVGGGTEPKCDVLAGAVNRLLMNLVLQCQRGESIRDYFTIGMLGYGASTGPAWGGELAGQHLVSISTVADHPMRTQTDSIGDATIEEPVWLDPMANGGTPMMAAIDMAGQIVVDWANDHMDCFPPIVVNISDGESTDGDPRPMAARLRDVMTDDGNLLFFNVNISSEIGPAIEYPNSPQALPDAYAKTLFEMSSELTPYMTAVARGMGLSIQDGARGFAFNADSARLSEFLDVGTRISRVADR